MHAPRVRTVITPESRPRLGAHVRLQYDDLRGRWAVLAPEKVLWPDDISTDILKRCDGTASLYEIIAALIRDYNAPEDEIGPDVMAFLQQWSDQLLVRCEVEA
ncbi:pyrroloquinoline quinone biosynthesis peptide chaperone PqqD [Breoghania sp. L-A4]|uniref:pyrroloquinoline quinone biosynthesis peptide chaperone PqqD n=1 Tax=Breoghania sp. L-A4 TaxID=2304600 RepID=UPI000E35870A|nr:pyrroloquinoline quinone biosynthesis peptide chaperone PqqD [Breoghania sp. L-A4]AXS42253.1 pyrroloquinoline quinone biosynthesis peptide chaperone PqqD [Breoghania sp. L-A4]